MGSAVDSNVDSTIDSVVESTVPQCPSEPVPYAPQYRVWALGELWGVVYCVVDFTVHHWGTLLWAVL